MSKGWFPVIGADRSKCPGALPWPSDAAVTVVAEDDGITGVERTLAHVPGLGTGGPAAGRGRGIHKEEGVQ